MFLCISFSLINTFLYIFILPLCLSHPSTPFLCDYYVYLNCYSYCSIAEKCTSNLWNGFVSSSGYLRVRLSVLGLTCGRVEFVTFRTRFVTMVTVKHVKVTHSLSSRTQCFSCGITKLSWTPIHASNSKTNNFTALPVENELLFVVSIFNLLSII
jgi:hypothetical protein